MLTRSQLKENNAAVAKTKKKTVGTLFSTLADL